MQKEDTLIKEYLAIEYEKCAIDPVYFIKNYCYIQHPIRGKIPFKLWPFQEKVLLELITHKKNIINKSRQLGISWLSSAYSVWLTQFKNDKNILVIATKESVAKNIIHKFSYIYKYLPDWIRTKRVDDNKFSQGFANNSKITAIATTEDAGRSEALSLLIIDECVAGDTKITIKNKNTNEIRYINIEELYKIL